MKSIISLIIPSRNNLKYLKQAYTSIRKYIKLDIELVILDDASTDGTWDWLNKMTVTDQNLLIYRNTSGERVGHTVLYDKGVQMCSSDIFGIFHADMIASPNYITNLLKHIKPKTVVSATRIEPPLHPPGPEKLTVDLGIEPEQFDYTKYEELVRVNEEQYANKVTEGVFAPWIMLKEDFIAIGGHDKLFAPMELEDSDLFNRMFLAGYKFIQSRDSFVYHMTCRGSRYKDGIEIEQNIQLPNGQVWVKAKDSEEYTKLRANKFREWWRKWKTDVLHDENMKPIVGKSYSTAFIIANCSLGTIRELEPWCDELKVDCDFSQYIVEEQPNTMFNLSEKIGSITDPVKSDISVLFDGTSFNPKIHYDFIKSIPFIIETTKSEGMFNWDKFFIVVKKLAPRDMIKPLFKNIF